MTGPVASLNTAWFAWIGLLWTGYFVLEGFDFGVGVLSLLLGRDDLDRRLCRNAIGPSGRQRGLADRAAGATAPPSGLVRQHVQRLLPRAVHRAGGADRARVASIPGQAGQRPVAGGLGRGARRDQPGARLRLGPGLHRPGARAPALLGGPVPGELRRPPGPGGDRRRAGQPDRVPGARRHVPGAKTAGPLAVRARRAAAWLSPLGGALVAWTAVWLEVSGSHGPGGLGGTVPVVLATGRARVRRIRTAGRGRRAAWRSG